VSLAIAGLASELAPSETLPAALLLAAVYLLGPRLLPRERKHSRRYLSLAREHGRLYHERDRWVLMTSANEELPREKGGRFGWFLFGAAACG
jgi:hypothetical protein